jgi:hypothetical protein
MGCFSGFGAVEVKRLNGEVCGGRTMLGATPGCRWLVVLVFSLYRTALMPQPVRSTAPSFDWDVRWPWLFDVEAVNDLGTPGQGTLQRSAMFFVSTEAVRCRSGPGMRGISVTPALTRVDAMAACHGVTVGD